MKKQKVLKLTITALMAAILCITAPLSIPLPFSTVPISLATFSIYLSAGILGKYFGSMSVFIYLLLGAVGVPVFAMWAAGFSVIVGPRGGYLFGYLVIAFITGIFADKSGGKIKYTIIGMILGTLGCYLIGMVWLGFSLDMGVNETLLAGFVPFIPGDIIKMILAAIIVQPVRKQVLRTGTISAI